MQKSKKRRKKYLLVVGILTFILLSVVCGCWLVAGLKATTPAVIITPQGTKTIELPVNTPKSTNTATLAPTSTPTGTPTPTPSPIATPIPPTATPLPPTETPVSKATPFNTSLPPTETSTPPTTSIPPVIVETPMPVGTPTPIMVCDCSDNLYNCSDFDSQTKAQECYDYCVSLGRGDIHRLDKDSDGLACGALP